MYNICSLTNINIYVNYCTYRKNINKSVTNEFVIMLLKINLELNERRAKTYNIEYEFRFNEIIF